MAPLSNLPLLFPFFAHTLATVRFAALTCAHVFVPKLAMRFTGPDGATAASLAKALFVLAYERAVLEPKDKV